MFRLLTFCLQIWTSHVAAAASCTCRVRCFTISSFGDTLRRCPQSAPRRLWNSMVIRFGHVDSLNWKRIDFDFWNHESTPVWSNQHCNVQNWDQDWQLASCYMLIPKWSSQSRWSGERIMTYKVTCRGIQHHASVIMQMVLLSDRNPNHAASCVNFQALLSPTPSALIAVIWPDNGLTNGPTQHVTSLSFPCIVQCRQWAVRHGTLTWMAIPHMTGATMHHLRHPISTWLWMSMHMSEHNIASTVQGPSKVHWLLHSKLWCLDSCPHSACRTILCNCARVALTAKHSFTETMFSVMMSTDTKNALLTKWRIVASCSPGWISIPDVSMAIH